MPDERNDQTAAPADGAPTPGADADAPRPNVDAQMARLTSRGTFFGLQMLATLVGTVGGVVLFVLLLGAQVWQPVAVVGGLVFALVARRAFTWLLLYWLSARATRGGPPA